MTQMKRISENMWTSSILLMFPSWLFSFAKPGFDRKLPKKGTRGRTLQEFHHGVWHTNIHGQTQKAQRPEKHGKLMERSDPTLCWISTRLNLPGFCLARFPSQHGHQRAELTKSVARTPKVCAHRCCQSCPWQLSPLGLASPNIQRTLGFHETHWLVNSTLNRGSIDNM